MGSNQCVLIRKPDRFLILSVGAIIGTKIGVSTLQGISENLFRWLFRAALFAAMLRILWKPVNSNNHSGNGLTQL